MTRPRPWSAVCAASILLAACSNSGQVGPPGVPCTGCVDAASMAPGAVGDGAIAASGITTRSKLPGAIAYEDEANAFSQPQTVQGVTLTGTPATSATPARLDVNGQVFSLGLYQQGTAPPGTYPVGLRRYVVEAGPAQVGQVVPLDHAVVQALCGDIDGCRFIIQMLNYDASGTDLVQRSSHLFLSRNSAIWRFDNDVRGVDGDGAANEWGAWDCYFTDAENRTNNQNGRADTTAGFGLLNALGGNYSDTTTVCRLIFED